MVWESFSRGQYFHFKKYWTSYKFLSEDGIKNGSNKYKHLFDNSVKAFRNKQLQQEVCTECFYYYSIEGMYYTDRPYVEAGLDSEYWYYCSEGCLEYRKDLNTSYPNKS